MDCIFCQKTINNKGSLVRHQKSCLLNPERIIYKNNFEEYNKKVKNGLIKKPANQWDTSRKNKDKSVLKDETRIKIGLKHKGKKISDEQKKKLSLARSKNLEELGVGGFKNIKWYKIKNINDEEFIVRGTWELKVAEILNSNNILWIRKIYLNYIDNNQVVRTYTPDFYLPNYNKYLEIKGFFSDKDKIKLNLILEQKKIDLLLIRGSNINDDLVKNIIAPISPLSYTQLKG
jgi:hypothetical protein